MRQETQTIQYSIYKNYPQNAQQPLVSNIAQRTSLPHSLPAEQITQLGRISLSIIQGERPLPRPRNLFRLTIILLVISLSSFYYGYSLTYLSTIPIQTLRKYYGPQIDKKQTLPILTGAMPFGAIFGSWLGNVVMRYFTRRNFLTGLNVLALLVNIFIQINNIWVLLILRLMNGVLVGLFMGLVTNYIKELSPHSVSGSFGTFTQMQHLFGSVVSYFVGMIFYLCDYEGQFFMRFQFQFTTILIILQMVLIFFGYIPQSPNSLVLANRIQQARNVLRMFNQQFQIQKLIKQKLQENDQIAPQKKQQELKNFQSFQKRIEKQNTLSAHFSLITDQKNQEKYVQMNWKSYFLAFQIPLTQQFTGTNFIVTQMTAITAIYNVDLSHYTALISNTIQFIATASSAYVFAKMGRRPILLTGNLSLAFVDGIIGFAFLGFNVLNWSPGFPIGITFIMIFNIFYGLFFGPVVWLYVAEISEKRIVPVALSMYWVGCTICVIVPPIITQIMGSPYASFLFLSAWQFIFFIPNYYLAEETKGLSAAQITKKFKKKRR